MIVIIGGNGYIGRSIAKHAINRGIQVASVSRSGGIKDPSQRTHWDNKVQQVKGNALHPEEFKDLLISSDKIVHCVGILRAASEQQYIEMNRDSAIEVAKMIDSISAQDKLKRKMVMISSAHYPPFMKKYLETKEEAESYIKNNTKHLEYAILKPGFIHSAKEKWWSTPLKGPLNLANNLFGNKSIMGGLAKFESTISLNEVCLATLWALEEKDEKSKGVFYNDQIEKRAAEYKKRHNILFTV